MLNIPLTGVILFPWNLMFTGWVDLHSNNGGDVYEE